MSPRRVALLGGAFDPPHRGHALAAQLLLASKLIDELWFVPSGVREDKLYGASHLQRLAMLDLFVQSHFSADQRVRIEECEIKGLLKSPGTIGLLEHLQTREPSIEFLVSIGSELVADLPSWKRPHELARLAHFLVHTRSSGALDVTTSPIKFQMTQVPNPSGVSATISSSAIRALLRAHQSISGVSSEKVEQYIRDNSLYL